MMRRWARGWRPRKIRPTRHQVWLPSWLFGPVRTGQCTFLLRPQYRLGYGLGDTLVLHEFRVRDGSSSLRVRKGRRTERTCVVEVVFLDYDLRRVQPGIVVLGILRVDPRPEHP